MTDAPTLLTYGGLQYSPGYPGQVIESEPHTILSARNDNATAIDFGVPVAFSTPVANGLPNVRPFTGDTDDCWGISVRNPAIITASIDGNNTVNYPQNYTLPVMRRGSIAAYAAETVYGHSQVLIITAGANVASTAFGSSKNGVAGAGRIALLGATWRDAYAIGTIGIIDYNDLNVGRTTT